MKKVEMNRAMTRARVPQQDVGQSSMPLVIGRCFSYFECFVFHSECLSGVFWLAKCEMIFLCGFCSFLNFYL